MNDRDEFAFLDEYDALDRLAHVDGRGTGPSIGEGNKPLRWRYLEEVERPERERQPMPRPSVLPRGENFSDDVPIKVPLHRKWSEYFTALGMHYVYTPNASTQFTLYARASEEKVHLLITGGGNPASVNCTAAVTRWRRTRSDSAASQSGASNTDWVIAVGRTPALKPVTWDTSIFNWRALYPDPNFVDNARIEWTRFRKLPWLWYRDVSAITLAGYGLRDGEPLSIAQCPICGEVSFVPFDGWAGMPLKACRHRDESRPLPVINGLMSLIEPEDDFDTRNV